jgi:hypothetical protein
MCASRYRRGAVRAGASRSVGWGEHGERAGGGQHDADRERGLGPSLHRSVLDSAETVRSAVIVAGCTWCASILPASYMAAVVLLLAGRRLLPGRERGAGWAALLAVLVAGTGSWWIDRRSGVPAAGRPGLAMSAG